MLWKVFPGYDFDYLLGRDGADDARRWVELEVVGEANVEGGELSFELFRRLVQASVGREPRF